MTEETKDGAVPPLSDATQVSQNDTSPLEDQNTMSSDGSSEEELQKRIKDLEEQLARSQADYQNLVRRNREELQQNTEWSENKALLKFLAILDNFERAADHMPEEFRTHIWAEGLQGSIRMMKKIFSEFGIEEMQTVGKEIDINLHEVINQIPHNTTQIQSEVEKGYTRFGKPLRHAKVIVGDGSL